MSLNVSPVNVNARPISEMALGVLFGVMRIYSLLDPKGRIKSDYIELYSDHTTANMFNMTKIECISVITLNALGLGLIALGTAAYIPVVEIVLLGMVPIILSIPIISFQHFRLKKHLGYRGRH